ncbi:MAG: SRPBCC domain-containing protein [Candidatus Hydrogenedentes bacterium]|nr:SRPBCC domain-containing protein [Candidatus Hydrogenedentota bacterium]
MNPAAVTRNVVRISRTIPATPHQVYRAWLDPDLIRRWMAPGAFEATRVEVDERIGGRYRIWHADAGASVGGFECEILELDPDRRIAWRWGFAGPDRAEGPIYDSRLHITLHETPDGSTVIDLVHEHLDDVAAALPNVIEKVADGWENVLSKLSVALSAAPRSSSASREPSEMRKPVFTETMQIGIVVRDLDAAVRSYTDDYGIGPWEFYQFKPEDAKVWLEHGQPAKPSTRIAMAMVGKVQWELIEPLDDRSIFAQFLAATGGGVHHIAVASTNFDEILAAEAKRGNDLVLSCELDGAFSGIKVAYLGAQRNLGVILEVFSGLPPAKAESPDAPDRGGK